MEIQVRRVEPGDFKAVQQVYAQPRAVWGTMQLPFPSEEMWKKRLAESADQVYGLVASVEGEIVGHAGLHLNATYPRRKHAASLGMAIHDKWQSRGVGTALMEALVDLADKWLNISRLELMVYTDNEPALRLYKKFGFEVEGTLRRHVFRDGEYVDSHTMARLR